VSTEERKAPLTILVVSDSTGETAERVIRSALVQFTGAGVELVRRGDIYTPERVRAVVAEAAGRNALIVHTLVSNELRVLMLEEARYHHVDAMDLLGPLLDRLGARLGLSPLEKPGLFTQLMDVQARQVEAVEFAFRHDDGQRQEDLPRAELVLVGVSRTMKTPLTLYLACRGWFVANVPLVPGLVLSPALLQLPPERVFGLTMSAARLTELRLARARYLTIPEADYASLSQVREELRYAHNLCAEQGWRLIDVTGKSVEEVAGELIALAQLK
jgi:hypothetical protein